MTNITEYKIKGNINSPVELIGKINIPVRKIEPHTENLEVNPSFEEQNFTPQEGTYYNHVKVNPINITRTQLNVTPNNESQEFIPSENELYSKVTVAAIPPAKAAPEYVSFTGYTGQTLDISWLDTKNMQSFEALFRACNNIRELDLSDKNTSNVTNLKNTFYNCVNLKELNLTNVDFSNVTNMTYTFGYCNSLPTNKVVGLNDLNISNATTLDYCFYCFSQNNYYGALLNELLDLSRWKFLKATNCRSMFDGIKVKKLILNSTNNPYLTNAREMFRAMDKTTDLDLSNFDISHVTDASNMFAYSTALSNDSLNSIMLAFSNNSSLSASNKTLKYLGFTSTQVNTMITLSNWNLLQANGWSTGY